MIWVLLASDPATALLALAFSLATLAMVFITGGGVKASILASANALADAVRYGAASVLPSQVGEWRIRAGHAIGFRVVWTAGAAVVAFVPAEPMAIAGGAGPSLSGSPR